MNYLICDHCQFKNAVNSERLIFCKSCNKKLSNNYLDWKKTKFNSSFEKYIHETTTENGDSIQVTKTGTREKKSIFKKANHILKSDKKSRIFIGAMLLQFLLFFVLIHTQNSNPNFSEKPTGNYLEDVKWKNYSISQNLSVSLPFELMESKSLLPYYLHNYINNDKCRKAESSKSFSVTIEKMNFNSYLNIENADLISVKDEYMQNSGVVIVKEEGLHLQIQKYKTYMERGTYTLNGNNYLYENYTLINGNEGVKIILSYLKDDKLLCRYADIVTKSLLKNKRLI